MHTDDTSAPPGHAVSLSEAVRVWARVAALSFGGPAGQIAVMHRIVVDEKRWISNERFLHALNYCMLLPGPEAQQLATYLGWLMHRTVGGLIAGLLFIVPGVIAIMALSIIYMVYGDTGFVSALFFGLKAAVLAIVLQALVRIGAKALENNIRLIVAGTAFVGLFFFAIPFPAVVVGAGLFGYLATVTGRSWFVGANSKEAEDSVLGSDVPAHARPENARSFVVAALWLAVWLVPVGLLLAVLGPSHVYSTIAIFFSKMAMVTFGGAYAVLAYVAQSAVEAYGWLKPGEMLDGLGMAETTPGPLIMVLQFVGFAAAFRDPGTLSPLMAGVFGGLLATWVTFAPCFLWIFLGAPWIERLRGNRLLSGALTAITSAVAGVILNLAVWFALHTLFSQTVRVSGGLVSFDRPVWTSLDVWAFGLAMASLVAVLWARVGALTVLACACLAGILLYAAGLR